MHSPGSRDTTGQEQSHADSVHRESNKPLGRTMKCPVRPQHEMVEIAHGLFQCPLCGYGPSQVGDHSFWAVSNLEITEDIVDGLCITWADPLYVMSSIHWQLDSDDERIPGTLQEEIVGYLQSPPELADSPLPIVINDPAKWNLPAGRPALHHLMFADPLGLKELELGPIRAPTRKSAAAPVRRSSAPPRSRGS